MSSRSSHVRTKVVALLVSLAALWAFAATVTLREGMNLLYVSTVTDNLGKPTQSLLDTLQQERLASVLYLASGRGADEHTRLLANRAKTDAALATWRRLARSSDLQDAATGALKQRVNEVFASLRGLDQDRATVDNGGADRARAMAAYTDIITTGFRIYGSLSTLDDPEIAKESRTLVQLTQAREILSQEDTLLAGVLVAGRFSGAEAEQFTQLVGAQRYLYSAAAAELPPADQANYQKLVGGEPGVRLRSLEDLVASRARAGAAAPINLATWQQALDPIFTGMGSLELTAANGTIERAKPAAMWVIVRLLLAGGLGLIAVVASIIISITTARSLIHQLERLRTAAWQLATERLPSVVERLRRGDEVDVEAEAPPLSFGIDEIGQVGQAFNAVQQTAIRAAVEQAELRRSVRDVFLSLARRSQALVHRQLSLLDAMERREHDAEELEELFRVDHLATRMRRNAENLIVLSGAAAGRGWRNAVPMVDVIRGALAEVEDYMRVTVLPVDPAALAGRAVGDVIHLLAELIENAVSFSPPYTQVHVSGGLVANGFAVEIEDRGLGMTEADIAAANDQLRHPPEFSLTSTARLGLYVVGRLAERHGIQVRLRESPYGGTTAIVLIPNNLVSPTQDDGSQDARQAQVRAAITAESAGELVAAGTDRPVPPDNPVPDDVALGDPVPGDPTLTAVPLPRRAAIPLPARRADAGRADAGRDGPGSAGTNGGEPTATEEHPDMPAALSHPPRPLHGGVEVTDAPVPAEPRPSDGTPVAGGPADHVVYTPSGLPWRVRQASLASPLRDRHASTDERSDDGLDDGSDGAEISRAPEEIRRMMASYQTGTRRGRIEAAESESAASQPAHRTPDDPSDPNGGPLAGRENEGDE
jgi:signal transduction histidine kinase